MTISVKTYSNGEVFDADDLNDHLTTIVDEINRLSATLFDNSKNLLDNGDFSIWQDPAIPDRWTRLSGGTSSVISRQTFAPGITSPTDNPESFLRTVVTSSPSAVYHAEEVTRMEDVWRTSGQTVVLSFWAKADSTKNIATEFSQSFGAGGSPSASVEGIGVRTHALTTVWTKFTATAVIPSITGKTLGTTEGTTRFATTFWFDAGSNFDARTNSLGQQSGTFDIANVQLEINDVVTDFEYVSRADQLARCRRYYEVLTLPANTVIATAQAVLTTDVPEVP